jgi:putative lipoprotein
MKKFQIPVAALALGFLFSAHACNKAGSAKADLATLANGKWELATLYGNAVVMPADREKPYLKMDSLGTGVSGFAGCNRVFGGMVLHGDSISFPALASTKMFCQDSQQVEDKFMQALNETRTYTLKGDELVLQGAKELAVLKHAK